MIWDNDARCCVLDFLDWTPASPITSEWRSQGPNHAEKIPKWAGGDIREEGNFGGSLLWCTSCVAVSLWRILHLPSALPSHWPPSPPTQHPHKKVCSSCLLRRDPSVPVGQQQPLSFSPSHPFHLFLGRTIPAHRLSNHVLYYCKFDTTATVLQQWLRFCRLD